MLVNNPVIAYSKQRVICTIGLDFTLNRRGITRIYNRSTCDSLIKGQGVGVDTKHRHPDSDFAFLTGF